MLSLVVSPVSFNGTGAPSVIYNNMTFELRDLNFGKVSSS
jgi:hypothetical protein